MFFISSMMQPNITSQEIELSLASKIANGALSAIETVKCFNGQTFELEQYKLVVLEAAKTTRNKLYLTQYKLDSYVSRPPLVRSGILVWWPSCHDR
jgi:ATP-binding cassette, subfamily B (MDR/TAP), member 1